MNIGKMEFNLELKRLADTFGAKLTSAQQDAYYEHVGPRIFDKPHLVALFRRIVETESVFPKIATILKFPSLHQEDDGGFHPTRWITDDCTVRECVGGLILVGDDQGQLAFRCPRCERWPNPKKPRTFRGPVTLRSSEEMEGRRRERLDILADSKRRDDTISGFPPDLKGAMPKEDAV